MISFISSLEVFDVAKPDENIFLWIAASIADAALLTLMILKTWLRTCILLNKKLCEQLFSSLESAKDLMKNLKLLWFRSLLQILTDEVVN